MNPEPAVIEAAAKAEHERHRTQKAEADGWWVPWDLAAEPIKCILRDHVRPILAATAPLIARATADAIAEQIADMRCIFAPGDEFAQGWIAGRDHGVSVARSHGSQQTEEVTATG